jgi:SAM-dependent methyltransferase
MDSSGPYAYFEDVNWGVLRLLGDRGGLDVLDVGCGFATTSEHIQKRGNRVTGIESSAAALPRARARIAEVVHADLQNLETVRAGLGGRQFDMVILADVLEHLAWPEGVLRSYREFLKPGGSIIVSLPNIGLWSVRLSLLAGRFEYADTGVLDRTHLRFFTRRTMRRLLAQAGFTPFRSTYNPGIVRPFVPLAKKLLAPKEEGANPSALLESRSYKLYLRTFYPVERALASLWPGMLAFQMVVEAR